MISNTLRLRQSRRLGGLAFALLLPCLAALPGCGGPAPAEEEAPVPAEAAAEETGMVRLVPPPPVGPAAGTAAPTPQPAPSAGSAAEIVSSLRPIGYWPMDEGVGSLLRDRSGKANHARAFNLPWRNGLLDFTSGFQWIEIPRHGDYRDAAAFSLGGWFFSRRDDYLGGSDLYGPKRHEIDSRHTQGVNLVGNAYDGRGSWTVWGAGNLSDGVALRLRAPGDDRYEGGDLLGVVHANRADVLDSAYLGVRLEPGDWHHLLYAFEGGRGVLYLDGREVASADGLRPAPLTRPLLVGNDMSWWMLHPQGTQSLHGSARDLVLFDRALGADEAALLARETRPSDLPGMPGPGEVIVDWLAYDPASVSGLPPAEALRVLRAFAAAPPSTLAAARESLLETTGELIGDPVFAPALAEILKRLEEGPRVDGLREALADSLAGVLGDPSADADGKARAALGLAALGESPPAVLAEMRGELQDLLGADPGPPRIEEFYRNALTRALLDLDRGGAATRALLGKALARPLLNSADLSAAEWGTVRSRIAEGDWMGALESYRALDPEEQGHLFFSEGDAYRDGRGSLAPNERAYSPQVIDRGVTYRVGSGVPWKSAKRISPEAFREVVRELPAEYREEALAWEYADSGNLFQVELHKELPDGSTESALLEGPWFVFEGHDQKMQGWTIDIDADGYLHLLGGMHNTPISRFYPPGVWEKMGFNRTDNPPALMYWVSKRPYDISEFEFVGAKDNPRNLPVAGMNYMNFLRDQENNMFLYGRISALGIQSWGLFRYDAGQRRWIAVGGDAREIVAEARDESGEDLFLLRTGQPWQPPAARGDETVFVWSWQPHFYNYIRAWGVRVDPTGRLHIRMRIRGLGEDNRVIDSQVYAWSDDHGRSWHRADGSALELPLTTNPAPSHNADIRLRDTEERWDLWLSLLGEAGYTMEEPDPLRF